MAKGGAGGRNDHQIDLLAGGRIRTRWRSWHVTGWRRSPKCCGGLLFVFGGASPGSAGVPPASLFLQTASHPPPLPRKAHQARLYGGLFHRARPCAGGTPALPGGLCAGETPALPGGVCAGETPALPGGLYSFPPPDLWRTPLEHPPTPSWPFGRSSCPFVDNLFAFLWISYVSWLCSSATISRATSRARSGWPGGREMAATTGWPPPP